MLPTVVATLTIGLGLGLVSGGGMASPCAQPGCCGGGCGSGGSSPPPSTPYTVKFSTTPATCGSIQFATLSYTNGQSVKVAAGFYGVVAIACSGEVLQWLNGTGGVSVSVSSGLADVSGNGGITAKFVPIVSEAGCFSSLSTVWWTPGGAPYINQAGQTTSTGPVWVDIWGDPSGQYEYYQTVPHGNDCPGGNGYGWEVLTPNGPPYITTNDCAPVKVSCVLPGAATFNGSTVWINGTTSVMTWTGSSTGNSLSGQVVADFQFDSWQMESLSGNSGVCDGGDTAFGGVGLFVSLSLYVGGSSSGPVTVTDSMDYAPNTTCNPNLGGGYETGSPVPFFSYGAPLYVNESINGLTLTSGQSYGAVTTIGCTLEGATWGPNISQDSQTSALSYCGGTAFVTSLVMQD